MNLIPTDRINGLLHRITGQFRVEPAHPEASAYPAIAKHQPVGPSLRGKAAPEPAPEPVPEIALKLDERSRLVLIAQSQGAASAAGYGNAELAADLLRCELSVPAAGAAATHNRAIVQRLAMVSRMIASIDADANLPNAFKQSYEQLRFTFIKSALADASFLSQQHHPLRAVTAELANRAAEAGPNDMTEVKAMEEALRAAVRDFDLHAAFVRPIVLRLKPLSLEAIREFWAQIEAQRDERSTRRRARNIVSGVIASRLKGLVIPSELEFIVNQEWAAVLTWRLVQSGTASDAWREGVDWLEQVLSLMRTLLPGQGLPAEMVSRLEAGLLEAGRAVGPALDALSALEKSSKKVEARPALTESQQITLPPLARLLHTARWFRVFDHQQQKMRWLMATRYDAPSNTVEFAEMDGGNPLRMGCDQFVTDLRQGLSSPNNPDEQARGLVAELRGEMQPQAM